jgi:hypothetical protein
MTIYTANYESAYSGNQPGRGTVLGDTFVANRPQLKIAGVPVPGFAALSSDWRSFDPNGGATLAFAGIDTRLQMAKVGANGQKTVCGLYKQLPLPTATGQSVELAIYGSALITEFDNDDASTGPLLQGVYAGLMVGDDLLADPSGSDIVMLGASVQRGDLSDAPTTFSTFTAAAQWLAFDDLPTLLIANDIQTGRSYTEAARYVRIRLRQRCTAPATFTSELACDVSESGAAWNCAAVVPSIPRLRKSVGFGIWCQTGARASLLLNFIDIVSQPYTDQASRIGGPLQFGAP